MGNLLNLTGTRFGILTVAKKSINKTKDGRILWNCLCGCGELVKVRGDHLTSGHTISCGCLQREIVSKTCGNKHPNWQGGKSFEPYPSTFNKQFKRKIRERDNYTCAICSKKGNTVHHIDYCKENTIERNCIVLCRFCHSATNFNRDHWQIRLTKIMRGAQEWW